MTTAATKHIAIVGDTLRTNAIATGLVLQKVFDADNDACAALVTHLIEEWKSPTFLADGGLSLFNNNCILTNGLQLHLAQLTTSKTIVTWRLDDNGLCTARDKSPCDLQLHATELLFTAHVPDTNWLRHYFLPGRQIMHMRLCISRNKAGITGDSREFIFDEKGLVPGLSILINEVNAGRASAGGIADGFLYLRRVGRLSLPVPIEIVRETLASGRAYEKGPGVEFGPWQLFWNSAVQNFNEFRYC